MSGRFLAAILLVLAACSSPRALTVRQDSLAGEPRAGHRIQIVHASRSRSPRPRRPQPAGGRHKPTSSPPARRPGGALVRATWFRGARGYCAPLHGLYAANGADMLGGHFPCGGKVRVTAGGRSVVVTILDRCAGCGTGIDLSADAFRQLAPLSRGVLAVSLARVT